MATISIADVKPVGFNLLSEEENFLSDLSKEEVSLTYGGGTPITLAWGAYILAAAAVGHDWGVEDR
ncbi:MAG: hypothetical protein KME50_00735 [Nostoc desertorum CM1-VF14]|jgi:hypothetical protein|nr:hypothetical protein [Nostoc desertorum CM1-VF14]